MQRFATPPRQVRFLSSPQGFFKNRPCRACSLLGLRVPQADGAGCGIFPGHPFSAAIPQTGRDPVDRHVQAAARRFIVRTIAIAPQQRDRQVVERIAFVGQMCILMSVLNPLGVVVGSATDSSARNRLRQRIRQNGPTPRTVVGSWLSIGISCEAAPLCPTLLQRVQHAAGQLGWHPVLEQSEVAGGSTMRCAV